ncbi:MAG: hypothetical protein ACTSYX_01285 [Candidatus Thorarchaeota archaeon]
MIFTPMEILAISASCITLDSLRRVLADITQAREYWTINVLNAAVDAGLYDFAPALAKQLRWGTSNPCVIGPADREYSYAANQEIYRIMQAREGRR